MGQAYFITGIDTDIGKSYVTGYLAKQYSEEGKRVITQKFIQTGCTVDSEDIRIHRKIMRMELQPEDLEGITCPILLSYPASPHLAASIDNKHIDMEKITRCTSVLKEKYDLVLIEGAGGIMVPTVGEQTTLDYIVSQSLPIILVTSPVLGSINHTLLTLEICRANKIEVRGIAYNEYFSTDDVIGEDTKNYLQKYMSVHFPKTEWINIPEIQD
jgi:dethiobiotin synthase